jgi:hypothetical protein
MIMLATDLVLVNLWFQLAFLVRFDACISGSVPA